MAGAGGVVLGAERRSVTAEAILMAAGIIPTALIFREPKIERVLRDLNRKAASCAHGPWQYPAFPRADAAHELAWGASERAGAERRQRRHAGLRTARPQDAELLRTRARRQ